MRKLILIVLFLLFVHPVFAIEADDSVDSIIKNKYNANSSVLPKLPKVSPKSIESKNFLDIQNDIDKPNVQQTIIPKNINYNSVPSVPQKVNARTSKLNWGKKINVKFDTTVSDRTRVGSQVVFVSQTPVVTKSITLPTGTTFYGSVVNSHSPQMLGNGGLLSIKTEYVTYNGITSYCEGNLVNVNHKIVLFNNIKGDNGYIKGISKVVRPAKNFYSKSLKVSKKLWNSPAFIIAPITYLPGALFLVGDVVVSPFIALFHKGDRVYINSGTPAVIKVTSPAYIEY